MVVGEEPTVKGGGAFSVGAVERAVGPAAEHGADEAFCLSVGLRAPWPGAQVADVKAPAGEGVNRGAVGGAVVGEQVLDGDAVTAIKRDRASEERDRRGRFLVAEYLGVGQARAVVDRDVHVVPARGPAARAGLVSKARRVVPAAGHAVTGAAADASELLDVDVDQLPGPLALVTPRGLHSQPAEAAHPDRVRTPETV